MSEFLRRLSIRNAGLLLFLAIVGIGLIIIGIINLPYIITGKTDNLNEIVANGAEPEKLSIVEADIQYVLGCYGISETKRRGATLSEKHHYVVMFEDGTCMSLSVKDKETINYLSKLTNETESYLLGYTVNFSEPLHITGTIKSISGEGKEYYHDALNQLGVPSDYIIELEIEKGNLRGILAVLLISGVVAIILTIRFFINSSKEKKAKARSFAALDEINNDPLKAFSNSREEGSNYNYDKINYGREEVVTIESEQNSLTPQSSSSSKFTLKKD